VFQYSSHAADWSFYVRGCPKGDIYVQFQQNELLEENAVN